MLDEAGSLPSLHAELVKVIESSGLEAEVIFVDDGSTDATWRELEAMTRQDSRVVALRLRRRFGKAAALSAGFALSRGELIVTLDGDGQDDPMEVPRCLRAIDEGLDVVVGWKRDRRDPFTRVLASRIFNLTESLLSGLRLHDHNSGLKAMRRAVVSEVRLHGELHRFIPALAHARGFRVGEIPVNHRPRKFGKSKYGLSRYVWGLLDLLMVRLLVGYRSRPQHVLGLLGFGSFFAGGTGLSYLAATWIARFYRADEYLPLASRPLTLYSVAALVFGAQMLSLGFLAGLLPVYSSRDEDHYSIKGVIDSRRPLDVSAQEKRGT
ncbi:MAG: glycosyltransferase family 2 protein [Deltaproteobacteria bacterium]|nr:glycosyltransferase family 2 protein [Deltaproteobacteria bacterium]